MIEATDLHRNLFDKIREYFPAFDYIMYMQGVYLGGGSLRTIIDPKDPIKDIDLFFKDSGCVEPVLNDLLDDGYQIVFQCHEGYMISLRRKDDLGDHGPKVQLITRHFYPSLTALVDSFDISACCAAWDGELLVTSDNWAESVRNKRGFINKVTYPVATLNRIAKYKEKGYWFSESALQEYIRQVQKGVWTDEQLALYID